MAAVVARVESGGRMRMKVSETLGCGTVWRDSTSTGTPLRVLAVADDGAPKPTARASGSEAKPARVQVKRRCMGDDGREKGCGWGRICNELRLI